MGLEAVQARLVETYSTIGKAYLNAAFPNEVELYILSFEVIDQDSKTVKYFTFPVMPSSFDETQEYPHTIKKTVGGTVVLSTVTFTPVSISIAGTFGRKFKILLGEKYQDIIQTFQEDEGKFTRKSTLTGVQSFFDERIKSGYGCCKILEEICTYSSRIDARGRPYQIIFHNPSLGNSYIVKVENLHFSMSESSNMIWNYSLSLTGVSQFSETSVDKKVSKQRTDLSLTNLLQEGTNNLLNLIQRVL